MVDINNLIENNKEKDMLKYLGYKKIDKDNKTLVYGINNNTLFRHSTTKDIILEELARDSTIVYERYRKKIYVELVDFIREITNIKNNRIVKVVNTNGIVLTTNNENIYIINTKNTIGHCIKDNKLTIKYDIGYHQQPEIEETVYELDKKHIVFKIKDNVIVLSNLNIKNI